MRLNAFLARAGVASVPFNNSFAGGVVIKFSIFITK
jgi:hypothetical protein